MPPIEYEPEFSGDDTDDQDEEMLPYVPLPTGNTW